MSFTCYASLSNASIGSIGPPAQIGINGSYSIVDTATNRAVTVSGGEFASSVSVLINTPINNQAAILPAVQAAIQAQETDHPNLSFIWVGL